MKLLILILGVVLAAEAMPYYPPVMTPMLPVGGQQFGNQFGGQQHNMGSSGFGTQGHQMGGGNDFYNRGQHHKNFEQIIRGSESAAHDVGGSSHFGAGGGSAGGFNNYNQGQSGFGQQAGNGYFVG